MDWLIWIPVGTLIVTTIIYAYFRPKVNIPKAILSIFLTTLLWWITLYAFKAMLGLSFFTELLLVSIAATLSLLTIITDEILKNKVGDEFITENYNSVAPILVTIFALVGILTLSKDATFFIFILGGIDVLILNAIYKGFFARKHVLLSYIYMLAPVFIVLFTMELSGRFVYPKAEYLDFSILTVRIEHLFVILIMSMYTIGFYRTSLWSKIPKMRKIRIA